MFENLIKHHNLSYLRYEYFDYHKRCPGKNNAYMNPFFKDLEPLTLNFKFYAYDHQKKV